MERTIKQWVIPRIPTYIQTYHLTLLTLLWSLLALVFGHLAAQNISWLWGILIAENQFAYKASFK